jgi:DNA-binding CsgD family transcriptional regulator
LITRLSQGPTTALTPVPGLEALTARERELVAWVATGRSNEEIGRLLLISPATVRTHVGRAMLKLRARDRAQLVVFAVQSGLTVPHAP